MKYIFTGPIASHRSNGNVLFLILIAVALFAALSYAVTSSTRSGNASTISKEKMAADAAAFIDYTNSLKAQFMRMNVGGVPVDGFNFNTNGRSWFQPCSTSNCTMFMDVSPAGTFPAPKWPKKEYIISGYQANVGVIPYGNPNLVRIKNVGTEDKAELVFYYWGLTEDFCKQINKVLGLGEIAPLDALSSEGTTAIKYEFSSVGSMPEPASGGNTEIGDQAPELAGKTSFCFRNTNFSNSEADFIQVLVAR